MPLPRRRKNWAKHYERQRPHNARDGAEPLGGPRYTEGDYSGTRSPGRVNSDIIRDPVNGIYLNKGCVYCEVNAVFRKFLRSRTFELYEYSRHRRCGLHRLASG